MKNENRKFKLLHRRDNAPAYLSILAYLSRSLKSSKRRDNLLVPYVLTCAAALECLLNDKLIQHCLDIYGPEQYKRFADQLTWLSIRGKLDLILPLLSQNKFALKEKSPTYESLVKLISLRNSLTHNKSYLTEHEAEIIEWEMDGTPLIAYPGELLLEGATIKMDQVQAKAFHKAVISLDELLRSPEKLSEGESVIALQLL